MPKGRFKKRLKPSPHHARAPQNAPKQTTQPPKPKPKQHTQPQTPIIPFSVHDSILLLGEGDFSFASALITHHGCANVTATTFEDPATLAEKYGDDAVAHVRTLQDEEQLVLYNVDCTKLSSYKKIRTRAPWDRIIFNFPHTGGLTKDVNRQVRANQALLSSFFASAKPLLASEGPPEGGEGSIIVTLFEGEPYTLWNIRDLARHAGLVVKRSWKFDRDVYPGYRHARTVGTIRKGGKEGGEKSETAWRGELRVARTFEFGLKEDGPGRVRGAAGHKKKRKRGEEDSSDDE
jgi:25S rRNA (uracil2634-N3)-methyltransferase